MKIGKIAALALLAAPPLLADQHMTAAPAADPNMAAERQAMETQAQADGGQVTRSSFTTAISEREPVDQITEIGNDVGRVYYFTELQGMAGQTVTHRWSYNDAVMAEVQLQIGGPRWRVWSSKNLVPEWVGDWSVAVVNEAGEVLGGNRFSYTATR